MTVGDTIQSKNGAGLGGVVTSYNGLTGPVTSSGSGVDSVDGLTGAVDLTTRYLLLTGGTLIGATTASKGLTVNPATTGGVGITVTGLAAQTGDLQRWTSSVPTTLASINANGVFSGPGVALGSLPALTGDVRMSASSAINWKNNAGNADVGGFSLNASDQVQSAGDLVPGTANLRALGAASLRWALLYANAVTVGAAPSSSGAIRLTSGEGINWRNNAGSADLAGWAMNSSDQLQTGSVIVPSPSDTRTLGTTSARWAYLHAQRTEINSTGAFGTNEYFRVGTPTTVDNLANTHIATDLGSNKGIVFQQRPAQAVAMWEVQTSAGGSVSAMGVNGALTVASLDAGSGTIQTTGTVQGGNVIGTTSLRSGSAPSATGGVRMTALSGINWRNNAGTADLAGWATNASDQMTIGMDVLPGSDNTRAFGASGSRWTNLFAVALTLGTNPAAAGSIRLQNGSAINMRNAANGADITCISTSSNQVNIGGSGQSGLQIGTPGGGTGTTSIVGASSVTIAKGAGSTWHNVVPTTTHALADSIFTPTATTQKPLVIQALAASAAVLTEWQNSTAGTVLASVSAAGMMSATGFTSLGSTAISTGGAVLGGTGRFGTGTLATAGTLRLGSTDSILWRNAANSANIGLTLNASNTLVADPMLGWIAGNEQTTVGAAGGASALPGTPTKYLKIKDSAGTTLVVPAYAAA